MTAHVNIAVDAMGGDFGPRVTLPACITFLQHHPHVHVTLFGPQDQLLPYLESCSETLRRRLHLIHAEQVVSADHKPSQLLRQRQDSSMAMALQQVHDGQAQACVSAGNTGALMVLGRMILRTLPGIDRPAIISAIPTRDGSCYLLDLGANVDCSAEQLLQFAIMGSALAEAVQGLTAPRVALLNVGLEEIKGNEQVKLASRLIREQGQLNYIGYIEGDDVFSGRADVVVCDGFTGNIALKSSEGLARLIAGKLRHSFTRNLYRRLLGVLARPVLKELQQQIDPGRRNGASLLGLQGIVIKSHGGAECRHFEAALEQALVEMEMNLPIRISRHLEGCQRRPS